MTNAPQTTLELVDPAVKKVLWAAMCAMVEDIHCPQDSLTEAEWETAEAVFHALNAERSDYD